MNALSPDSADAVIDGRHADPFHYLGPHDEGDAPVVRVFLPDADAVAVGRRTAAESELRAHARRRACSPAPRRAPAAAPLPPARALWRPRGRDRGSLPLPAGAVAISTCICSARARICGSTTSSARIRWCIDGVAGVAFAVWAPNARRVSVVGDFNFWDGRRHAMRVRGNGFWEIFVPGARPGDELQIRDRRRPTATLLPLKSDPVALRGRSCGRDRLDRRRRRRASPHDAASARATGRQRARRADLDLRGASRLVAAAAGRGQPLADLSRAGRRAAGLCRRHGLHPCRIPADQRSIRSTARGAISRPACSRRPAASARPTISPRLSTPAIAPASA